MGMSGLGRSDKLNLLCAILPQLVFLKFLLQRCIENRILLACEGCELWSWLQRH